MTGEKLIALLEQAVANKKPPAQDFPLAVAICALPMRLEDRLAEDLLGLRFEDRAFIDKAIGIMKESSFTWMKDDGDWGMNPHERPGLIKIAYDRLHYDLWLKLQRFLAEETKQEAEAYQQDEKKWFLAPETLYRAAYHGLFDPERIETSIQVMRMLRREDGAFISALAAKAGEIRHCRKDPDGDLEELLREAEAQRAEELREANEDR